MENLFNPFILAIVSFLILQLLFMTIGKNYFSDEKMEKLSVASHPNLYVLIISVVFSLGGLGTIFGFIDSKKSNAECTGFGNQNCIDKVRSNLTSSGKQILNESYLDNGIFKITSLDPNRGITFNSIISTDCNCRITNVEISAIE